MNRKEEVLRSLRENKLRLEIERDDAGRSEEGRMFSVAITNLEISILYLKELVKVKSANQTNSRCG